MFAILVVIFILLFIILLMSEIIKINQKLEVFVPQFDNSYWPISKISNQPPFIFWHNTPKNTVSYALILEHVKNSVRRVHWLVYNIPAKETKLDIQNNLTTGLNFLNNNKYIPPNKYGIEVYAFTLYALNGFMDFGDKKVNIHNFLPAIKNSIIQKSEKAFIVM